ncbi:MAG: acetyl-CoA decarbonylase/synthase complex subunit delta [Candidatus Omnitrophica bacterium]|nr:acetyl-CoA decarbonylase/synthase complex subunit delta [Candidatus Omnitrophota bacterium]
MEDVKLKYTGKIREVEIGVGDKKIKVGGQDCLNFHTFEGVIPNPPVISFEVWDSIPEDWPESCLVPYKDVINNPVEWAKKCVNEYSAKCLTIFLNSTDPNGLNRSVEEIRPVVEKLVEEIDIPMIFWGTGNVQKDIDVLKMVCEVASGKNVGVGPVVDKNYKQIGASAIAYKQVVVASTPIDINLAKQLNILLLELGVPENKIIMDPTIGALGYGIEYTYSVMERDRLAGLLQGDDKLAFPLYCYLSKEVWKIKEVSIPENIDFKLGKEKERGIMFEALTGILLLLAGADIVVIRHPETVKLIEKLIMDMK